jgi:hypothetical protein
MFFKNSMFYNDGKIKFMQISGTTLVAEWAPGEVRAPYIDKWQAFVDEENKRAETDAPSMKGIK